MSRASQLRAILSAPGAVPMPSCHDALSARLIEQAGFSVAFMSGFSTSAAKLGRPDVQLITYSEMLEQVRTPLSALIAPHRLTFLSRRPGSSKRSRRSRSSWTETMAMAVRST